MSVPDEAIIVNANTCTEQITQLTLLIPYF